MANNIVQINSNNGINVTTQTSNDIISVVALGPQGPQGPQGEPGSGFPFNGGIAQITGSLQVTGSTILTGNLNVSEGITGSLLGTSSWAQNSITASYALNASGVDTSSLVTTSSFNSFTSSIQSFNQSIQFSVNSLTNSTSSYLLRSETSSLTQLSTFNNFTSSYNTGSFTGSFTGSLLGTASKVIIGDLGSNVYPIAIASPSGDILKADGFTLNGSTKFLNLPNDYYLYMPGTSTVNAGTFLGNLSGNVTGNLTGTASFATSASRALNSNSASYATTASYALNGGDTIGTLQEVTQQGATTNVPITASIISASSLTGSLFGTSSWANNATSASYALDTTNASTASYVENAQTASYVLNAVSSSFALTASYALNADNIDLDSVGDDNTYGFVFKDGTSFGYNKLYADSQEDTPSWNPSTNTFKAANIVSTIQFSGSFNIPTVSSATRFNIPLLASNNNSFQRSSQGNLTFSPGVVGFFEPVLYLTGSLNILSGSITITSGSLIGTSSFATTASYVLNAISASYIQNAQSASYVLNAISSSFTTTASYALNGGVTQITAGNGISIDQSTGNVTITNSGGSGTAFPYTGSALITGSLTITGSTTSTLGFTGSLLGTASRAVSSSYALTASYALSSAGGGGGTSLGSIFITLYDGGSNLTTGIKDTPVYIPYDGTATGWEMLAYNSSNVLMTASCVVDILQGRFATLPLSGSNSMAGSEKPTLTNQSSSFSSSLSTWTSITAGEYVQAEIESISGNVAKIVIAIKTTKSS
jgi:hypothetical protein